VTEHASCSAAASLKCDKVDGKSIACNGNYGATGWAGLASIATTSDGQHVAWGTAKVRGGRSSGVAAARTTLGCSVG
jgi:hypothetical protein